VLDEIAFFCMDLEAEGFYRLSKAFTDDYFHKDPGAFGPREQMLFTYYKSYRANVRAKVNALRAMKAESAQRKKYLDEVKKYLNLMDGYLETSIPKF
jgi:aminoglycoside phosphotransferase family enzyme